MRRHPLEVLGKMHRLDIQYKIVQAQTNRPRLIENIMACVEADVEVASIVGTIACFIEEEAMAALLPVAVAMRMPISVSTLSAATVVSWTIMDAAAINVTKCRHVSVVIMARVEMHFILQGGRDARPRSIPISIFLNFSLML